MIWLKLKVKDKNKFFFKMFKKRITVYETKEDKENLYVKVSIEDKEKIKKLWYVKILDNDFIGLRKIKREVKKHHIFLFGVILGLVLLFVLSHVMVSVEISHESKEIRDFVREELKERGIKKNTWKKSYQELTRIKEDILSSFPDKLEWLEIEIKGMNYIVRVEERKLNVEENKPLSCHVIAKKDGIIKEMIYEKGMSLVKQNDVVKKGDILVSGLIKNNEEVKGVTCATGSVYAEVWYKVKVNFPLHYEEETLSGKTRWNFKWNDFYIFKNRLTSFKEEPHKLFSFLGQTLSFVNQKETNKESKKYEEEEALDKALESVDEKIGATLKGKEKILTKKVLKKEVNDSTMLVEVFVVVLEDIAQIEEFIEGE